MKLKFVNLYLTSKYINFISINPNYWMLKSYYRYINRINHDRIEWTDQLWQPFYTVDQITKIILNEQIDILCLSVFVWNSDFTYQVAKKVKDKNPNIKIIVGGPDIVALTDKEYFKKHSYVDYAVYGDGEEAFAKILDSILNKSEIQDGVNTVTKDKVYPHKIFYDKEYNKISSIMSEKTIIKKHVEEVKNNTDVKFLQLRWERARGCPYKCSFCDWSSGLHHKVKRKKSSWKEELDFLFTLPVMVVPTDANWGIYQEDIEITEYAVNKGRFFISNLAKLHKDRVFKMYDLMVNSTHSKPNNIKISLQDIHEDVLENIDRPEIPWEKQKILLKEFNQKNPDINIVAEIIVGLPGQTIEKQFNQMLEFKKAGIKWIICFFWELIPNSPASNVEYQEKFKVKFEPLTILNEPKEEFSTIEGINNSINNGIPGWSKSNIVTASGEQDLADILTCFAFTEVYKKSAAENDFSLLNETVCKNIHNHMKVEASNILDTKIFGIYSKKHNCYVSPDVYFFAMDYNDFSERYTEIG